MDFSSPKSPLIQYEEPRLSNKSPTSISNFNGDEDHSQLSLDLHNISSSPKKINQSKSRVNRRCPDSLPLQEIVLLPPPYRKPKTRQSEKIEVVEKEEEEPIESGSTSREKCKIKATAPPMGSLGCCGSPRVNGRRSRRRLEQENRDEREMGIGDETVKPRKKLQSHRSRKEKLSLINSSSSSPKLETENEEQSRLNNIKKMISDLIMWKDVSKSSLWFGFGCLCFLSSFSTQGIKYSIFSGLSHLGLLILALSFFCNSYSQRNGNERKLDFELKEDDIVRVATRMLPLVNLIIAKTKEIFSGEPSMTLKVAPFLLFGAEYGYLLTLGRLCSIGFLLSFTTPKLYSCYFIQINRKVELLSGWVLEAWRACSSKKIVAVSATLTFWSLSSIKTRIFSAFVCMVVLRCRRQNMKVDIKGGEDEGEGKTEVEVRRRQHMKAVIEGGEEERKREMEVEVEGEREERGKSLMVIEKDELHK